MFKVGDRVEYTDAKVGRHIGIIQQIDGGLVRVLWDWRKAEGADTGNLIEPHKLKPYTEEERS